LYQRQVASGKLEYDEHQFAILKQLDDIDYNAPVSVSTPAKSAQNPTSSSTDPLVIRSTHIESAPTRSSPRGAYLWGDVGTGKSMLMDLLFNNAPVQRKRRVHFHSFMLEVQARIHERNQTLLADKAETIKDRDAVGFVGQELSQQCRLLCFDEMQLTDICDAFLISKILTILWTNGVILVATSNRPPLELYKDGLNRAFFVPFLRRIEKECAVHSLQSGRDYRQTATPLPDAYFTPDNADTRALLWSKFTAGGQQVQRDVVIPLPHGRTLTVPFSCNRTCFISFRELCELERGAADYRGLANAFSCVYLYGVPLMSVLRHDFARRFITLIDELYDAGTRLCWTSAAPPVDLFRTVEAAEVEFRQVELGGAAFGTDHTWADRSDSAPHTTRDPVAPVPPAAAAPVEVAPVKSSPSFATHGAIDAAQEELKLLEGELASVQELRFAFKRAASRLTEMSGAEYVERWTTRRTKSVEL
jgi:predicted ATPase